MSPFSQTVDILAEALMLSSQLNYRLSVELRQAQSAGRPATKRDLEMLEETIIMKLSVAQSLLAKAAKDNREALGEIKKRIDDLVALAEKVQEGASDPDVTNPEFLATVEELVTTAKELAEIVPNVATPTTTQPSGPGDGQPPTP